MSDCPLMKSPPGDRECKAVKGSPRGPATPHIRYDYFLADYIEELPYLDSNAT